MRGCGQDTSQEGQEIHCATQSSGKGRASWLDGDTGWLLEGLVGSRPPSTGCPKAPECPVELERGMRRAGSTGLTFQEAVPDPFVLPPGVSLGHLLQGLDPFGTEGFKRRKKIPKRSVRTDCQLQEGKSHKKKVCAGWHHENYFYCQSEGLCLH